MSGFRDKELEEKLADLGGKVSNSVSKNTTYLNRRCYNPNP